MLRFMGLECVTRSTVIGALAGLAMLASAPAHAVAPDGFEDLAQRLLPTVVNISTTAAFAPG